MVQSQNKTYGADIDFPPIDGPRAPLVKMAEFEDYAIDGSVYSLADCSGGVERKPVAAEFKINFEASSNRNHHNGSSPLTSSKNLCFLVLKTQFPSFAY